MVILAFRCAAFAVGLLALSDLGAGLGMYLAPEGFSQTSGLPLGVPALMQGYGQRILLLGGLYAWLAVQLFQTRPTSASWLWLPCVDEAWNAFFDAYAWKVGTLPAHAVAPMAWAHGLLAVLLFVSLVALRSALKARPQPQA